MMPYQYVKNNPVNLIDTTGMKGEDWYLDKDKNYVYDSNLTRQNSSSILSKDEEYVGESVKINLNRFKEKSGTITLSKDGEVSAEGNLFDGVMTRNSVEEGLVEVDFNFKKSFKIYGTQENSYFSGNAKDQYELNKLSGIDREVKELDIEIKNISREITGHHNRVKLDKSQRDFDKWLSSYSEDGRKLGDAGDALNTSRHERDSVNKVKVRNGILEKRNSLKK